MSNDLYPLPAYAANIWYNGQSLMIGFPPLEGETRGHTVAIPIDRCGIATNDSGQPLPSQRGWLVLLNLLKERHRSAYSPTIGTDAAPVQYDVEGMLRVMLHRAMKRKDSQREREIDEATKVLQDAGLL